MSVGRSGTRCPNPIISSIQAIRTKRQHALQTFDSLRISAEDREVDALRRRTCPGRESRTGPRGIYVFKAPHRLPGNTRPVLFDSHSFERDSCKLDLNTAQREIASNWIEVYQKYVGKCSGKMMSNDVEGSFGQLRCESHVEKRYCDRGLHRELDLRSPKPCSSDRLPLERT